MTQTSSELATVTLRVSRFSPRAQTAARKSSSPFGERKSSNPFGSSRTPNRPRGKRWSQDYELQVSPDTTLLDCLLTVKRTLDPTLAFRYSCGHGICGSDAVAVNGSPTLLCTATVMSCAKPEQPAFRRTNAAPSSHTAAASGTADDAGTASATNAENAAQSSPNTDLGVIEIAPLPGFTVQRDLIVDIDTMMTQIASLKPYLQAAGTLKTKPNGDVDMFEYLQNPEQLARYEKLTTCISCGICEGSCPVYAGGEAFLGPAALVSAGRFINDSRDEAKQERIDAISSSDGVAACAQVRSCSRACPQGIDVGEEMWKLVSLTNSCQQ